MSDRPLPSLAEIESCIRTVKKLSYATVRDRELEEYWMGIVEGRRCCMVLLHARFGDEGYALWERLIEEGVS